MWPLIFQDELEIEDWFQQQKQKLDDQLYKRAMKMKDVDAAKKQYDAAFNRLLKQYERQHFSLMARKERKKKMNKPIMKFRERRKQVRIRIKKLWEGLKKKYKKWTFEREYKKLWGIK